MAGRKQTGPKWFASKKAFFVTINGQRINLGPDKKTAEIKYHDLMGNVAASTDFSDDLTNEIYDVETVVDLYLTWVEANRKPSTLRAKIQQLNRFLEDNKALRIRQADKLKPIHISDWLARNKSWNPTTKHTLASAVQTCWSWAKKQGLISVDNLRGSEKPTPQKRQPDEYWTRSDFAKIKAEMGNHPAGEILAFIWETGCRPVEAYTLKAKDIDFKRRVAVIRNKKAKGDALRVITLSPKAIEIVKRQNAESGTVFRNSLGNPWNKDSLGHKLRKVSKRAGTKTKPYLSRHGFATEMLTKNVDIATVSALMGHRDTRMVSSTYSHLIQEQDFLQKELAKRG